MAFSFGAPAPNNNGFGASPFVGPAPKVDDYFVKKKVPDSQEGRWCCSVCSNHFLDEHSAAQHCQDAQIVHLEHSDARLRVLTARFDSAQGVKRRASLLPHNWQNHVLAELFRFVDAGEATSPGLDVAQGLLEKYERMERFSLLELAVWKSQCQLRAGEETLDSSVKTVEDAARFVERQRDSWKKYRTELRPTNAIAIVIENVLPFVGKPPSFSISRY